MEMRVNVKIYLDKVLRKSISDKTLIECLDGKTRSLEIGRDATLGEIREKLKEAIGLSDINCIRFKVNGDDIEDNVLASKHDFFQKGTEIHAVLSNLPESFFTNNKKLEKIQTDHQKAKKEREEENAKRALEKNRSDLAQAQAKVEQLQASLNKKTKSARELLFQAIRKNNIVLFNETFEKFPNKADILQLRFVRQNHHRDNISFTPLFEAARIGSVEIVNKLLEVPGINIDEKVLTQHFIPAVCPNVRQTPLGIAIQNGHLGVVKLLLSKGANPDCSYWNSPNAQVTAVVNMYKYRMEIEKELHSWWYEDIILPVKNTAKKHCAFFKEHFPHEKAVKLEAANLITDVLEGKKNASVFQNLTEKQKLAIGDGRLKEAFEKLSDQQLFSEAGNGSENTHKIISTF